MYACIHDNRRAHRKHMARLRRPMAPQCPCHGSNKLTCIQALVQVPTTIFQCAYGFQSVLLLRIVALV